MQKISNQKGFVAIFQAFCEQILSFLKPHHWCFLQYEHRFFSCFQCIIQFFSVFRGKAKSAVLRALPLPAGTWWAPSELALGTFSEQSPVGNGASDSPQSSQSPGYKWAIWCHQSQLSLSARRVQNILNPCCSSCCVQWATLELGVQVGINNLCFSHWDAILLQQHWLIFTSGTASILAQLRKMMLRWHFSALQCSFWALATQSTLERSLLRVWPSPREHSLASHPMPGDTVPAGLSSRRSLKTSPFSLVAKGLPLPKGLKQFSCFHFL